MDKQQLMQLAETNPQIAQAVDAIEQQMGDMPATSGDVQQLIAILEAAIQSPQNYQAIREQAVSSGMLDPEDLPEQFEPVILVSLLVVMYRLLSRLQKQGYARGGLAQAARQLQAAGRGGDTMLAHINPREAEMLRRMGGAGTINPHTGLPEYWGIKNIVKAAIPIALSFIAPGVGTAISNALNLSLGTAGSALLGGAVTGGLGSALSGGNVLQGAALGALGQGLGGSIGNSLAPDMSSAAQNALGSGLVGGALGAATGQGFAKGIVQGALGSYLGSQAQGVGSGAMGAGLNAAGKQFGNMMAAGYKPGEALTGAGLAGLVSGISAGTRPSQAAVDSARLKMSTGEPGLKYPSGAEAPGFDTEDLGTGLKTPDNALYTPASGSSDWLNAKNLLAGATMLGSLSSAPQPVQQAVAKMSPEQQAYFNRPSVSWNWDAIQRDAENAGQPLPDYMSRNWNVVTSGKYNQETPRLSKGGALSQVAYLARGAGSGRADTIDARLSDGEYVMDAETVALLGDGSTKEGARRLDAMREQLRQHKGKSMARGKFSANAKSPLAYLKEAR